jgi:hypothetical protein
VGNLQPAIAVHHQPAVREAARRLDGTPRRPLQEVCQIDRRNGSTDDGDRTEQPHRVVGEAPKACRDHTACPTIGAGGEGVQPERRPGRLAPYVGCLGGGKPWRRRAQQGETGVSIERTKGDGRHGAVVQHVADGFRECRDRWRVAPGDDDEQRLR